MLLGYQGVFIGKAAQTGRGTFEVIVALTGGSVNSTVGMVYYDLEGITNPRVSDRNSRSCAPLKLVSVSNDSIVLREEAFLIQGKAIDSEMTLKLLANGDLDYSFHSLNKDLRIQAKGTGTLRRKH